MAKSHAIADLELSLAPLSDGLGLTLRYRRPNDAGEDVRGPFVVQLDPTRLISLGNDHGAYGTALADQLFATEASRREFISLCDGAFEADETLRLRFHLHDPALHTIRWELLHDPARSLPLALDTRLLLTRFISAERRGRIELRPRGQLRALIAVAAPDQLGRYQLAPINVQTEIERACRALSPVASDTLGSEGECCTLTALGERLRADEGYDILYLVAHGAFTDNTPWLYLERDDGEVVVEDGRKLADLLRSLDARRPRLVVLSSCTSAGNGYADALAALGSLLAQAGVPAVLAMQGQISVATIERFAPVFFRELLRDGLADRALAAARLAVRDQSDWWMPVLYTRLREGRIWNDGPRATFYGDYTLPAIYVERDELLAQVREQLLSSPQGLALTSAVKVQRPAALHGMGGIGKTVLARALCDDPAIRAAFPDGIFWVTLGQTPELVRPLRGIVEQLGGIVSDNAPTTPSLKAQIAGLLEQKACLFVADDVWRKQDAELLRVGGPRCRLLATTRDAALVESVGAQVYPVPVMAPAQGRLLLREWAEGALDQSEDRLLDKIVLKLGALPLALQLAGAQLRRKEPQQWLAEFDVRKLRSRRREQTHDSLERTFGLSLDQLSAEDRRLYAALAIFREDEATPEIAVAKLWQGLAGLDADETAELVEDLAARALLELRSEHQLRVIVLHDLLRDLMAVELGADQVSAAHNALLCVYRPASSDWHEVKDDGYLYDHLVYHLQGAQRYVELNKLFADQVWMERRFRQRGQLYDGYIEDLSQVILLYQRLAQAALPTGDPPLALIDLVRCALIRTSINSQASSYEPILVASAVARKVWSIGQALSLARRIPEPARKVGMIVALFAQGQIPAELRSQVTQMAFDAATTVEDENEDEERRGTLLRSLTPWLNAEQCTTALALTRHFRAEKTRAAMLEALAPQLNYTQMTDALALVRDFASEDLWVTAVSALAPRLSAEQRAQVLPAVYALKSKKHQVNLLGILIPHLTDEILTEALVATVATNDQLQRIQQLQAFIPYINLVQLRDILQLYASLDDADKRDHASAIESFATNAQSVSRRELLAAAFAFRDPWYRTRIIAALASWLEGDEYRAVLTAAKQLGEDWQQATILESLAPYLQDTQLDDALTMGLAIKAESARGTVLCALAPRLHDDQVDQAFLAAWSIYDARVRRRLLTQIAPRLRSQQMAEILTWIRLLADERSQIDTITALFPHLGEDQQGEVLAIARELRSERYLIDLIEAFAPHVHGQQFAEILARAYDDLHSESIQADALQALATHMDRTQCSAALTTARGFVSDHARLQVLQAVMPQLNHDQLELALTIVQRIDNNELQARGLLSLAPHGQEIGQPELYAEAFDRSLTVTDGTVREELLALIVPRLNDSQLAAAMRITRTIHDRQPQAKLLASLTPYLPHASREEVLSILQASGEQEGTAAILALETALHDDQVHAVLATVSTLSDEWARARILRLLIPQLQPQYLQEVFGIAYTIHNERARVSVFAAIANTRLAALALRTEAQKEIIALIKASAAFSRGSLLLFLVEVQFPLSFGLAPELVEQLVRHSIDICGWQWP